jgi:hypothetical protein
MLRLLFFTLFHLNNPYFTQCQPVKIIIQPQSILTIQGKTNVNTFQCYCELPATVVTYFSEGSSETQQIRFKKAALSVLTKSLDCRNKMMNRDMYQTLKAEFFPTISLALQQVTIPLNQINDRWKLEGLVFTEAILTLAGMERKIDLQVRVTQTVQNTYRFTARKSLLLTDYGLTPPSAMMGMVKVRNEIWLAFDIYVSTYSSPTS